MPRNPTYHVREKNSDEHEHLSEDWLLDNLPEGWHYDCVDVIGETPGFVIFCKDDPIPLFIPLRLLK